MKQSYRKNLFIKNAAKITAALIIIILHLSLPSYAAEEENKVQLDADKLIYEDATGIAKADGNVRLRNKDMRMYAPYAEYDTENETIKAFSDSRNEVSLLVDGKKLTGQSLNYNIATRKGVMTDAAGKMDAIFFKGRDLEIMPLEEAIRQNVVSSRNRANSKEENMVAKWTEVASTTCDFSNPHYIFLAKEILVIQNKKVVIKRPQVYIGKHKLFNYPFDYVIPLNKGARSNNSVMPRVAYDSSKGVGIGIGGPIVWDSGEVTIDTTYWTDDIWEAKLKFYQRIAKNVYVFADTNREYNKDEKETLWRPKWGLKYSDEYGWSASIYESQRELVETEMRPGQDRRYNVWRSPEFTINTPWFKDPAAGGYFRLSGIWGRYQDNVETIKPWTDRLGMGVQVYGEPNILGSLRPFYNASYWYYDYDGEDSTNQKVTDAIIGLRWGIGKVGLETAYVRRWVSGESQLTWDNYLDREDIYQKISFTLPGGTPWESWNISLRAGYDLVESQFAEMIYTVSYIKHCITWELWARDSKPESELTVGLKFIINAYPEAELKLGEKDIFDPFKVPDGLNLHKENMAK